MKCKAVQEILLTDELDHCASKEQTQGVQEHLKMCASCRAFAQELTVCVAKPFEHFSQDQVPADLFLKIKGALLAEPEPSLLLRGMRILKQRFFWPQPALVLGAVAVVFLLFTVVSPVERFHRRAAVNDFLAEQSEFLSSLSVEEPSTMEEAWQDYFL